MCVTLLQRNLRLFVKIFKLAEHEWREKRCCLACIIYRAIASSINSQTRSAQYGHGIWKSCREKVKTGQGARGRGKSTKQEVETVISDGRFEITGKDGAR